MKVQKSFVSTKYKPYSYLAGLLVSSIMLGACRDTPKYHPGDCLRSETTLVSKVVVYEKILSTDNDQYLYEYCMRFLYETNTMRSADSEPCWQDNRNVVKLSYDEYERNKSPDGREHPPTKISCGEVK